MDGGCFIDSDIGVTLAPFVNFGFGSVASWSEVELYAAAGGIETDLNFYKVMIAMSYYFAGLYDAFLTELRSPSGFADGNANSVDLVDCVFRVWDASGRSFPEWRRSVEEWLYRSWTGGTDQWEWNWNRDARIRKKYEILDALDAKFPYLMTKFYAARSSELHTADAPFVSWFHRKLEHRAEMDPRLAPVLVAVNKEMSAMRRRAMFMS